MKTGKLISIVLALAAVCGSAAQAADPAKDYPIRPIRLVMPNAPGSSADTMGRIAATRVGDALGQQIVVDNRAGAGGTLGMEIGKNATPDGYTIITTSLSALTVSPHIRKNLAYDPIKDFEYVALYSRQGNVLVVHPGLPVKSVKELVEYARAKQGKVNMARVVSTPEMREQLALQGAEPATGTPEEFRRAVQEELAEMGKLVKVIGLKAD